jgi:uncharacterized glyoxalase superfamily protein PhnB
MLRTFYDAKAIAKTLRAELHLRRQIELTHGECLEIVSRQFGADSWNVLSATISRSPGGARTVAPWGAANATIPVLRIFSVDKALQFYVEFLGFSLDFGGPVEGEGTPFYGQITRCGTSVHLTEHQYDPSPGATILVWMSGLDALYAELDRRRREVPVWGPAVWTPEIEEAPWGARVLTVGDPFGNHLRFNEPTDIAERAGLPHWG